MRCIRTISLFTILVSLPFTAMGEDTEGPEAPETSNETLTLDEAQELAIRHHPGVRNLDESIYQADMLVRQAWSALLPSLRAGASITRNEDEVALQFPDFSAFNPADPTAALPTSEMVIQERCKTQLQAPTMWPVRCQSMKTAC